MFGFVYLNPTRLEFSSREFDRCVRDGPIVGIKPLFGELASSPNLDKIIEGAASPTPSSFSTRGGRPPETCRGNPLRWTWQSCGHTRGNWELGYCAVRAFKNVSIDLAGSRQLRFPTGQGEGANIADTAKNLILGKNLRRMMTPIRNLRGCLYDR